MDDKKQSFSEKWKNNKKDVVKNILIIFLLIMLFLTFFSNTIMNYSLPEISATYAQSGSVTSKVRGNGEVEAAEDYEVNVTENHIVSSVKVKVGDVVEEGQLLFELESSGVTADDTTLKTEKETLANLELEYNKALLAAAPSYAMDNLEIKAAQEELNIAIANQSKAGGKAALTAQIAALQGEVDSLQTQVQELKESMESLSGNSLSKTSKKLQQKQKQLAQKEAELAALKETAEATPSPDDAAQTVREKQKALDTLLVTLSDKKRENGVTQGQASLDLAAMKKKAEEQREYVEQLENGTGDSSIKAKNAGVVKSISCIAGDTVTADNALAVIAVTGNGYSVHFPVTKEQAKLVRTGQEADILNVWGEDIKADLSDIKVDTENPNKNMILTFQITGEDVSVGQNLSLSVGEKSAQYDVIVPNSAIHEDNKGKFVLVVNVKSSPLGNRYVLSRADVEVLASDDNNSAVSGGLFGHEYVVTNATQPLESGMKVRLAE